MNVGIWIWTHCHGATGYSSQKNIKNAEDLERPRFKWPCLQPRSRHGESYGAISGSLKSKSSSARISETHCPIYFMYPHGPYFVPGHYNDCWRIWQTRPMIQRERMKRHIWRNIRKTTREEYTLDWSQYLPSTLARCNQIVYYDLFPARCVILIVGLLAANAATDAGQCRAYSRHTS